MTFACRSFPTSLIAKARIGSSVIGVELELGVGEGDQRVGEVEGDSALSRAELDASGY
jgi:hypothetical protein